MSFVLEATGDGTRTFAQSLGDAGMGILIVFVGLICLIALVAVLGKVCQSLLDEEGEKKAVPAPAAPAPKAVSAIENRDELIVAFSAAVAEELGTDVSAIRVVSFKEIG